MVQPALQKSRFFLGFDSSPRSLCISVYLCDLCDLCVKYFSRLQLTQRSQRYTEIAEKNQESNKSTFRATGPTLTHVARSGGLRKLCGSLRRGSRRITHLRV